MFEEVLLESEPQHPEKCMYCLSEFARTDTVVYCNECSIVICLQCKASGAEGGQHRRGHNYHMVNLHGGQVFDRTDRKLSPWGYKDDQRLIMRSRLTKASNWPQIAINMRFDKDHKDLQNHFDDFIIRGRLGRFCRGLCKWKKEKGSIRLSWLNCFSSWPENLKYQAFVDSYGDGRAFDSFDINDFYTARNNFAAYLQRKKNDAMARSWRAKRLPPRPTTKRVGNRDALIIDHDTLRDASKYVKRFKRHLKHMKVKDAEMEEERKKFAEEQKALEEQEENEMRNKEKENRSNVSEKESSPEIVLTRRKRRKSSPVKEHEKKGLHQSPERSSVRRRILSGADSVKDTPTSRTRRREIAETPEVPLPRRRRCRQQTTEESAGSSNDEDDGEDRAITRKRENGTHPETTRRRTRELPSRRAKENIKSMNELDGTFESGSEGSPSRSPQRKVPLKLSINLAGHRRHTLEEHAAKIETDRRVLSLSIEREPELMEEDTMNEATSSSVDYLLPPTADTYENGSFPAMTNGFHNTDITPTSPSAKRLCNRQRSYSEETVAAITDPSALLTTCTDSLDDSADSLNPIVDNGVKEQNGRSSRINSPRLSVCSDTREHSGKMENKAETNTPHCSLSPMHIDTVAVSMDRFDKPTPRCSPNKGTPVCSPLLMPVGVPTDVCANKAEQEEFSGKMQDKLPDFLTSPKHWEETSSAESISSGEEDKEELGILEPSSIIHLSNFPFVSKRRPSLARLRGDSTEAELNSPMAVFGPYGRCDRNEHRNSIPTAANALDGSYWKSLSPVNPDEKGRRTRRKDEITKGKKKNVRSDCLPSLIIREKSKDCSLVTKFEHEEGSFSDEEQYSYIRPEQERLVFRAHSRPSTKNSKVHRKLSARKSKQFINGLKDHATAQRLLFYREYVKEGLSQLLKSLNKRSEDEHCAEGTLTELAEGTLTELAEGTLTELAEGTLTELLHEYRRRDRRPVAMKLARMFAVTKAKESSTLYPLMEDIREYEYSASLRLFDYDSSGSDVEKKEEGAPVEQLNVVINRAKKCVAVVRTSHPILHKKRAFNSPSLALDADTPSTSQRYSDAVRRPSESDNEVHRELRIIDISVHAKKRRKLLRTRSAFSKTRKPDEPLTSDVNHDGLDQFVGEIMGVADRADAKLGQPEYGIESSDDEGNETANDTVIDEGTTKKTPLVNGTAKKRKRRRKTGANTKMERRLKQIARKREAMEKHSNKDISEIHEILGYSANFARISHAGVPRFCRVDYKEPDGSSYKGQQDEIDMLAYFPGRNDYELELDNEHESLVSRIICPKNRSEEGVRPDVLKMERDLKFVRQGRYNRVIQNRIAVNRAIFFHNKNQEFLNFVKNINLSFDKRSASQILGDVSHEQKMLTMSQQCMFKSEIQSLSEAKDAVVGLVEKVQNLQKLQRDGYEDLTDEHRELLNPSPKKKKTSKRGSKNSASAKQQKNKQNLKWNRMKRFMKLS